MKARPSHGDRSVVLEYNRRDDARLAASVGQAFRLKHILVPTDFSDCAFKALQYALPLARTHDAAITLLYVAAPVAIAQVEAPGLDCSMMEDRMRETGEKELKTIATAHAQPGVNLLTAVRTGMPAAEIIAEAARLPVDLIIISTHGRTGLAHAFLGSVAESVVQRAPCPVLVVREREHEILA